jgi:hypothetical protein
VALRTPTSVSAGSVNLTGSGIYVDSNGNFNAETGTLQLFNGVSTKYATISTSNNPTAPTTATNLFLQCSTQGGGVGIGINGSSVQSGYVLDVGTATGAIWSRGTISSQGILDMKNYIQLFNTGQTNTNTIFFSNTGSTNQWAIQQYDNGYVANNKGRFVISRTSANDIVIDGSNNPGYVGINTISPGYQLDVSGYFKAGMPRVAIVCTTATANINNHIISWTANSTYVANKTNNVTPTPSTLMWNSSNPTRITAPISGYYSFTFRSHIYQVGGTGTFTASFRIYQYNSAGNIIIPAASNTSSLSTDNSYFSCGFGSSSDNTNRDLYISGTIQLLMDANDYIVVSEWAYPSTIAYSWNFSGLWTSCYGYCTMAI